MEKFGTTKKEQDGKNSVEKKDEVIKLIESNYEYSKIDCPFNLEELLEIIKDERTKILSIKTNNINWNWKSPKNEGDSHEPTHHEVTEILTKVDKFYKNMDAKFHQQCIFMFDVLTKEGDWDVGNEMPKLVVRVFEEQNLQ